MSFTIAGKWWYGLAFFSKLISIFSDYRVGQTWLEPRVAALFKRMATVE